MSALLSGWYVDSSPGFSSAKCGGRLSATGISGYGILYHPIASTPAMADHITLNNFPYLVGKSVQVAIGGIDCGDKVVAADGSITVDFGSDTQGLMTVAYLVSISNHGGYGESETHIQITDSEAVVTDLYVPVVVGYGYTSQGMIPRAVSQEEMKTPKGPGVGKTRRKHMWAANLWNAVTWKLGTSFDNLQTFTPVQGDLSTALPSTEGFTGIHQDTLDDTYGFDGQLCWQVDRPVPLGVVSLTSWDDTEDR